MCLCQSLPLEELGNKEPGEMRWPAFHTKTINHRNANSGFFPNAAIVLLGICSDPISFEELLTIKNAKLGTVVSVRK